jgi:glycosyltransferase involved in cell wall biosynthesis
MQRLCTVCERGRVAQALVLAESFLEYHANGEALVVVADEPGELDEGRDGVRLTTGAAVAGDAFPLLAGALTAPELARAVVPYALLAPVVYLAPDAWVRAPLEVPEGDAVVVTRGSEGLPVFDPGFLAVRAAEPLLPWWREREVALEPDDACWADAAVGSVAGVVPVSDDALGVAPWNAERRGLRRDGDRLVVADGRPVPWIRFAGYRAGALPGVDLATLPALREELDVYQERVERHAAVTAPGFATGADGTPLDARLRRLFARGVRDGALTDGPFSKAGWAAFLRWLDDPDPSPHSGGVSRYLLDVHRGREELQRAYPDLRDARVREGFHGWVRMHGREELDLVPALLPGSPAADTAVPAPPWGVNVAGYFQSELGIGEAARRLVDALDAAQVPVLPVHGSINPPSRRDEPYGVASAASSPFPVNLICVNADGLPAFAADVGEEFFAHRYSIGFWWWELAEFPAEYHGAFEHVDEVWVGSQHALEAIGSVASVPVVHMTLPVRTPRPLPLDRAALGLPDGFLFLVTFDYNSVFARKNPLGVVDAFTRAFSPGSGAALAVKSVNAHRDPSSHQALITAASRHPDVHVLDRFVSAGELDAMLAACDAYVSLHRAEGFGLGLAEAMALGKPVVATGYSGNLDYMDEQTAWLVPYRLTAVGEGAEPYPAAAQWAEPDLDAAAAAMRRIVEDPDEAAARGRRASQRIHSQHSSQHAGEMIARRLELVRARAEDLGRGRRAHPAAAVRALLDPARERARIGAEAYGSEGSTARDLGRKAMVRAARPLTANQGAIDSAILEAVERVAAHAEQRHLEQVALYAGALQRIRRQEAALSELGAALERAQKQLDEH